VDRVKLEDVAAELGTKLRNIPDLRVLDWSGDAITPPAAIIALPERIEFDGAYARGLDKMSTEFMVLVSRANIRAATKTLSAYAHGSGSHSVKAVVDSGPGNEYETCDEVTVQSCEFDTVQIAGTVYLAAVFTAEIIGSGA
jgi:hypothetical protein